MWTILAAVSFLSIAFTSPAGSKKYGFSSVNEFSFKLLDNTYSAQEIFGRQNFALSPISIWSIFALLTEGSSGETFLELKKALRIPNDLKNTQILHRNVKKILHRSNKDVELNSTSAMFAACSIDVNPEFCKVAENYGVDISSVDLRNLTKLARDINYYICTSTGGRVQDVVKSSDLENLKVIFIDALYFRANWTYPFEATLTREDNFYDYQGKSLGTVNMMYHEAQHTIIYPETIEAEVLELPYGKNKEYSMLILLPFEGVSIKKVLNNLATQPTNWLDELKSQDNLPLDTECYLPRFKISSQINLNSPLRYSGINRLFDSQNAELPGVSSTPLYVTKALQNVEIEVNEEGTIASSATVIGLETRFGAQKFEVNKEFIFLITHRDTNVVLFSGIYTKPTLD